MITKPGEQQSNKSVLYQLQPLLSVLCFYTVQRSVERQGGCQSDEHTEDECMWKTEGTKMILRCESPHMWAQDEPHSC